MCHPVRTVSHVHATYMHMHMHMPPYTCAIPLDCNLYPSTQAQVRAQRQDEKRDAQSRGNDKPQWARDAGAPKKVKGANDGAEAKKDQELVLYEFLNMLVRIAFWRSNPNFGLHGNKDELVPVAFALSSMLNEIILPRAKRENSAAFRNKEMQDPKLLAVVAAHANARPARSPKLGTLSNLVAPHPSSAGELQAKT